MRSRARPLGFAAGALVCAVLAATMGGGGGGEAAGLGDLRPVLVTAEPLERGTEIDPPTARSGLAVRQVPADVAPPDALAEPVAALGARVAVPLPAGSYLTRSSLAVARRAAGRHRAPGGTTPVELEVVGAGALGAAGIAGGGIVDVVVAPAPGPGPGARRARVAAAGVRLLALRRLPSEPGLGERWAATLALSRPQALELIRAEGSGLELRLLARA